MVRTTAVAATMARVRTSHSDMSVSGFQRERGRSTATANTAGAVTTKVSETNEVWRSGVLRTGLR